ncbi:MAG: hypothetical protein H6539_08560 [Bacteroidales bacterium]|nr:hypothetical protein [Bacteroidales bacterium]
MSFIRKFSTVAMWVILLGVIIAGFIWFSARNMGKADSRNVLPDGTALFLEFSSLPELLSELEKNNEIWKEINNSGLPDQTAFNFHKIDSLFSVNSQAREFFHKKFTLAISLKANKSPGVLFLLPLSQRNQLNNILKILESELKEFNFTRRRFENKSIYDLSWKDASGVRTLSITEIKKILTASFSSELVEEAIRQSGGSENFVQKKEFAGITHTLGNKVPVNLFFNYKETEAVIDYLLKTPGGENSYGMRMLASWNALDGEVFTDKLVFNGFTSMKDSLNPEFSIFRGQEAISFNCPDFLPDAISMFKAYGFSDKDKFFEHLAVYMKNDPGSRDLLEKKKKLLDNYGIDPDKAFSAMIGDEFGYALVPAGSSSYPFFFMELKSQSLAEQQFREWLTSWALKNGNNPSEFFQDYKIDSNNKITIYKMALGGVPAMVFGPAFRSSGYEYFAFINNYVVFANSSSSLKEFIYKVILGNTLASGLSFSSTGDNISSRSNYFLFVKPAALIESSMELLNDKGKDFVSPLKESISRFNAFSIQYSSADDLMYNHVLLSYSGSYNGSVNTVWKSRLDTSILFKPAVVINHVTGEKEIFVQDLKNQIYLLSNAGVILWKQQLDGPLLSDVFQVDYYRNGKLQYLFNTKNKIYLIDRNGNPVEKYPVELRSDATAGLSVFDYDKDGSIRICVPCDDRKIYMYDKEGKLIPGWQPEKTDHEVLHPVQHFRVGKKDYIVAIDKYKFYILDRRGSDRVTAKQYFQVSENNSFYLDLSRGEGLARMVTTDTAGSIMRVYFSGKVEKVLEGNLDAAHYFVYSDLDGDKKAEYLTASGRTLKVLNPELKEDFNIEMDDSISFKPVVYSFSSSDNKIGLVLNNPGNIYLYNNNGSLYKGFPLEGATPFTISSFPELSGRFNMIVGSRKNFLYNYSVQ